MKGLSLFLKLALFGLLAIAIYLGISLWPLSTGRDPEMSEPATAEEELETEAFLAKSEAAYLAGLKALEEGDRIKAITFFDLVEAADERRYNQARDYLDDIMKDLYKESDEAIRALLSKYEILEAANLLAKLEGIISAGDYQKLRERIDSYERLYQDMESYEGPIEHVFTHCLIAFPEICYASPSMLVSLDADCITPYELNGILTALYENDYILIDINMIYEEREDGSIQLSPLVLPKGKKPVIFSVDDVTYDQRKMSTGMVDKLIVDENGRIATYTRHPDGEEVISYENEVFPILEAFVRSYPDFSFKGARGTLCLTGFDGILGYRIQDGAPDQEQETEAVSQVVAALKEEGWTFASHSYGHGQMNQMSGDRIQKDILKWQNQVAAVVGETKIFVWPYGASIRSGQGYAQVYNEGFRLFCGVGSTPYLREEGGGIFMDRKALDGYALRNRRERYLHLFDTQMVMDPLRPKQAPR